MGAPSVGTLKLRCEESHPGRIERSAGKARRVVDLRPKEWARGAFDLVQFWHKAESPCNAMSSTATGGASAVRSTLPNR